MTLPFENDTNAVVKKLAKQTIKANHRTALSIMSAILIAATFLCTLCTLVQSYWNQRMQQEIFDSGNWDAQILEVQANQIELIKKNENIKGVMVKGNNQTFLLSFRENAPYLLVQNCDAKYWESMHEKNLIIRGRVPKAPGEIVVGKKFFEDNPSFKIGDTVDLELGERRKDNRIVDFLSPLQDGEVFVKTDNVQYTIVGEIDRTVSSAYNGYPAYGWLNLEETPKDASVVVYTQTKNPRKIYETVPQIAQAIGLEQDEYGEYPYRYHTALLGMYGIYEPGNFWSSDLPKLFLSLLIVAVASMTVFAYIIRGAFSISAKRKIKELGILKSIGMTPKQIRRLVKYEARWLSFFPIVISIGLGHLLSYGVLTAYSKLTREVTGNQISVSFSPWIAIVSIMLSFLTVLLAASGPARQMGKIRPIEAIKENWNNVSLEKSAKHTLLKRCFGFLGKISANSLIANKKLFRTCTVTLCLCMVLMFSFLAVFSVSDVNNTKAEHDNPFDINITLEAIKENWNNVSLEKSAKHTLLKRCFGFLGKISANSLIANKKLFRTCTVTLCLCMVLMFSFLAVFSVSDVNNTKAEHDNPFDINITLESGQRIEPVLIQKLKDLSDVKEQTTYTMAMCASWLSEQELSKEFLSYEGFDTKAAGEYVVKRDGRYRIPCTLIGLEQDTYNAYLKNAGISSHNSRSAVIVNSVAKNPDARGYEAKKEQVSYLDIKEGQRLQLTEKFLDSVQGNYSFDIQISSVLTEMPDIGLNVAFYTLPIIVPMEEYYEIIKNFGEDRAVYNYRTYMNLRTEQGKDVTVQSRADQLCGEYLSKNDFFTSSKTQRAADRVKLTNATMLIVYSLTALFGIVGISSAVAAILNSLYQRKKEFAMLRSVGLDKKGLCHLLYTEGFLLVIKPLLIGISILILVSTILIWLQDITFIEFLKVFPLWRLVVYVILTFAIIRGIYMVASRKIRRDIIVEVLKDETV